MAVGANRTQVHDRINHVLTSNLGQRANVMNVDVPFGFCAVRSSEIEFADPTATTVGFDALAPGFWIALVGIDNDTARCALNELGS